MKLKPSALKVTLIYFLDILAITAAGALAYWIRFDFRFADIPTMYLSYWYRLLSTQIVLTLVIFSVFRMYSFVWRAVGANEAARMVGAVAVSAVAVYIVRLLCHVSVPRSVMFIEFVLELVFCVGMRYSLRVLVMLQNKLRLINLNPQERVMLIGAGSAGQLIAREIKTSDRLSAKLCCVIDDNRSKWGKYLEGYPIIGGRESIPEQVESYRITEIIFAIPTASVEDKTAILNICKETGCRIRLLPGIFQIVNGSVVLSDARDIRIEDLLGREPVEMDKTALREFFAGKTVLVTGGGGSIGSELCRQIAHYSPKKLIILDCYENNAYDLQQELKRAYGAELNQEVIIASVRDKARINEVFLKQRPDIVFHAAAHKHVPLMEDCPREAIKNNIFGTWHVIRAAEHSGCKKMVMISTDKAVNPTSVMGATKRYCEILLQSRCNSSTDFCSVRFGNVLGSNGSVVPLFKKQIEEGGPVTVTDNRITRFFMTIPEAAQLVLQAGAMAERGQIYVLDMGKPVRIRELAENMIRLSGLEPGKDIEIREIGLRPGEKLYEELLMHTEHLTATENRKIFIEQQGTISTEAAMEGLQRLDAAISGASDAELVSLLKELVPTYRSPEEANAVSPAEP